RAASDIGLARPPDVIDRRFVRDRQRLWITAFRFGQPVHLVEESLQLRRAEWHRGIGANGMPAVTESRHAPQRGLAVAPDPDRRMRLLHGVRQALDLVEAIELAAERRGRGRPERLE